MLSPLEEAVKEIDACAIELESCNSSTVPSKLIARESMAQVFWRRVGEFSLFFALQFFNYCMLTYNYRMISQARTAEAILSDCIISTGNYFIIRKIANSEKSASGLAGYVLGGGLGTFLGITLSKILHWS